MKTTFRPYQSENDFWNMRAFLRKIFVLNDYTQRSWHVARLEYARWHTCLNCAGVDLKEVAFLWEDDNELVAFLMPDGGRGEAHLCVHPQLRTAALEEEMLAVAEENLHSTDDEGLKKLFVWSPADNLQRQEMFTRHGYTKDDWPEHQWRRKLDTEITPVPVAPGYTIRSLGDGLELLERCYASGLGFHEGDFQVAAENRADPTWYRNIQTAPSYRRDLDLVAVTSDGEIAAFATIWFDDVTRSAYFEPVATVPVHRKRGLGKALLTEGLRRLQRMGALYAFVGGYSPAANALYCSVMGDDCILDEPWTKKW
ncbi:MAG TPA: GNAT family N-acetyltransferase [Anaerolineales bacterium]|nr:GNAT family N-acetyltransferase [Anaerolineales bacterium]